MTSLFGGGYVFGGTHSAIKTSAVTWSQTVSNIRCSLLTSPTPIIGATVNRTTVHVKPTREFFEAENLGIMPPRRCNNCMNSRDCSFRAQQLSQRDQYEYSFIESKVKYNPSHQCFHVEYPFIEDPRVLPNNIKQVKKIAEREEKKLKHKNLLTAFNKEFDNMIAYGALIELSQADMEHWDGPVHYVSLQHVENPDSPTTPLRIVSNSSLSDRNGVSVKSILMKGPNALSNSWDVLTRWRNYEVALNSDLTKAYYSLRTGELEKHIRRVVWRYGVQEDDWRVFAFQTVSFGDRPASVLLEIAIKQTAQRFGTLDPEAAHKITNDRYVDDFASGGTVQQVERFVGKDLGNMQHDGTMPTILSQGSLQLKVIVTSGESNEEKIHKLGQSVLGIPYDPRNDVISIKFSHGIESLASLMNSDVMTNEELVEAVVAILTMRLLLRIINGIYDALGLASPFTIRLKVAFRDLFGLDPPLTWDDIVPQAQQELWRKLLLIMLYTKEVQFSRPTKPSDSVGKCQLICYFDGSDVAFAAVTYVRWEMADGSVVVNLMGSKAKVTPLERMSTPRSELNGAVLAARLAASTVNCLATAGDTPERVWFLGDSECTLASLENVSTAYGEYFGNRIGEVVVQQSKIERQCKVGIDGEWWFIHSKDNGADIATRFDSDITTLFSNEWQHGREYLKLPPDQWPKDRNFASRKDDHIPQNELLKRYRCLIQNTQVEVLPGIDQLLDPHSTNDWNKLIHKTQLLLKCFRQGTLVPMDTATRITASHRLWFLTVMCQTTKALNEGRLKELDIRDFDGMKVVIGRAQTSIQKLFGKNYLPVIMADTRVAELIMLKAHYHDHSGRDITMAMSRHDAWIISAKKLAKQIIRHCIRCRFVRKRLQGQKMAVLPSIVQEHCPPFTNVGLDFRGPVIIKAMTNKRGSMKVWILLFLCLNTKAISLEISPGYSTEDFLLAYSSHVSIRGNPTYVHSDRGSQLVAARKELCDEPLQYDWNKIASSTERAGTTWNFAPAGAQWRNGSVEAFVKKFKLSFLNLYRETRLNYAEMNCAIKRITNVLNHRPVSVQRTKTDSPDHDFLVPLTPNMLLTGHCKNIPPQDYVVNDDPHVRQTFVEELECAWWYQFKVQYFDALIPTRKWIDAQRNMVVGDVVLIEYSSKTAPGTYRLGRVSAVEVDHDNLVRTCTVTYKLIRPITQNNKDTVRDVVTKTVRVPVQRLVLLLPVEEQ